MRYLPIATRQICHASALLIAAIWAGGLLLSVAYPQSPARAESLPMALKAPAIAVPGFWGAEERVQKPDLIGARVVRFLTDDEFPPLHFAGADGQPTGFSVELARAACAILDMSCTVQVRRFDTLLDSLAERRGDVVAAAIPIRPTLYGRFSVTGPYHRMPARFAVKKAVESSAAGKVSEKTVALTPDALAGKRVAIVQGTAHEAYITEFFPRAERVLFTDLQTAEIALKAGEVHYLFADGMSLALWLNGASADGCCSFAGGPYLESRFFGEGVGFILRKDDLALRNALDYALRKLWENGTYTEIYLRHFPVSFY
ncbi:transporter substrate-binding domain-containing protein [Pseudochelatococcus sp. G4_1912]|uniref:transporter substrate-binding domain-containing protein n=1 Tax=Pseudochelatococcus sp. G4_1912 TaxID=3114288 RepID=UPI0039C7608F